MKILIVLVTLIFVSACGNRSSEYVYHDNPPRIQQDNRDYPLKSLDIEGNIDILWVIDNSGSMSDIQNNVIKNAKIFMEQFVRQKYINWKMGVISTDRTDIPYIGFNDVFDYTLVNHNDPASIDAVVQKFQDAVRDLGTNGDYIELTFFNILRVIQEYSGQTPTQVPFLRTNSHLAVIMVTDEKEQSVETSGSQYQPLAFLNTLRAFISNDRNIRFYGALKKNDLQDCDYSWDAGDYKGSPFEEIINATGGFNISACIADFGTKLVEVSKDIASMIKLPSILLPDRPKVHTLKVYYEKLLLNSGKPGQGGYWYYSEKFNTINFYNLDFVKDITKAVFKIKFDIDDGIQRPGDPDDNN